MKSNLFKKSTVTKEIKSENIKYFESLKNEVINRIENDFNNYSSLDERKETEIDENIK